MYQYNMIQEGCNTGNGRKTWLSQSRKIYRTRCTGKVNLEKFIELDALVKSTQKIYRTRCTGKVNLEKIYITRCTGKVNLEKFIELDALVKSTQEKFKDDMDNNDTWKSDEQC